MECYDLHGYYSFCGKLMLYQEFRSVCLNLVHLFARSLRKSLEREALERLCCVGENVTLRNVLSNR